MKTWFRKFNISVTLDQGSPRETCPVADEDHELVRVHRALSRSIPVVAASENLHQSIMTAVRFNAERSPASSPSLLEWVRQRLPRFALAAATACLLGFLAIALLQSDHRPDSSADAIAALDSTFLAAAEFPNQITPLAPLEEELERLARDIEFAADYLLGTSPL